MAAGPCGSGWVIAKVLVLLEPLHLNRDTFVFKYLNREVSQCWLLLIKAHLLVYDFVHR